MSNYDEQFSKRIREIADLVFANAISHPDAKEIFKGSPREWSEKTKSQFQHLVHDGFKKGQDLLIEELLIVQEIRKQAKESLKKYRQEKDRVKEELLKVLLSSLDDQEAILLHIGDGIAWQLLGGQVSSMRRFYTGDTKKELSSSNIKHAKSVADGINKSPEKFALISDITHSIQVGDLLIIDRNKVGVMELKEGKVNDKLGALKNVLYDTDVDLEEIKKEVSKLTLSEIKQFERMLKQDDKLLKTVEVMNTDKGTDLKTGKEIQIMTPKHITMSYCDKIESTIKEARKTGYAVSQVDGIVQIGVYTSAYNGLLPDGISKMFDGKKFKVVGDLERISRNVSQPIFAKPFDPGTIIDILLQDVNVVIGIDLEAFFTMLKDKFNIDTRVLSRKETMKLKEGTPKAKQNIFEIDNQAFEFSVSNIEDQTKSFLLGGGIISKLLYDNITPESIALDLKGSFEYLHQAESKEGEK